MKKISALFLSAALFFAAGAQAQVVDAARNAVSSGTSLIQRAGDVRSSAAFQADCAAGLALDSCAKPVTPQGCPAGRHWTTMGSGIAHCVDDDPVCQSGQVLKHDWLGNPYCHTVVYTKKVEYRYRDCTPPKVGQKEQKRTLWYADGVLESTGTWITISDNCTEGSSTPEPTPTCSNGAPDYPTCTAPVTPPTGSNPTPTNPTCSNGASDWPICTSPGGGGGGTPESCSASDTVVHSQPCGAGETGGPIETHRTVSCPGSVVGSYTTGQCKPAVCANGAKNWPTCTIQAEVKCNPDRIRWCEQDREKSDDPRDIYYYYGETIYSGPTCSGEKYTHGSRSEWDGGCPAGYN